MDIKQKIRIFINKNFPKLGVSLLYFKQYKKFPNLCNPKTFNEKIQYLKLFVYGENPLYCECSDKYRVRHFIKNLGYEKFLIPIIGVYKSPQEIDFNALPDRFVLKWNFGNGFNIICNDKKKLDIEKTIKQLEEWSKVKSELISCEYQYRDIPKLIICEENIALSDKSPIDYKFHCFKGECKLGFTIEGRETGVLSFYSFDKGINHIGYEISTKKYQHLETPPMDFDKNVAKKLLEIAEILSIPFQYVRVDLFFQDGKIYFGEYTFSDGGGFDKKTPEADKLLGDALDLDTYK